MSQLQEKESILQDRINALETSLNTMSSLTDNTFCLKELPARHCVQLNEYITRDEEMDLIIKKLHQKHENKIRDLGNLTIGAFLSMPSIEKGIANVYDSVFFVLESLSAETQEYDFILPEGHYLSYFYRGSYEQNARRVMEMTSYLNDSGYTGDREPFELFTIDNRDTMKTDEFLTEIQIYLGGN